MTEAGARAGPGVCGGQDYRTMGLKTSNLNSISVQSGQKSRRQKQKRKNHKTRKEKKGGTKSEQGIGRNREE